MLGKLVAGTSGESKRKASEGCDGAGEEDCLKGKGCGYITLQLLEAKLAQNWLLTLSSSYDIIHHSQDMETI